MSRPSREAGYPALEMDSLGGLFGPRGMPLAVREQIAADVRAVIAENPAMVKPLEATGQIFDVRGPDGIRRRHQGAERQARRDRQADRDAAQASEPVRRDAFIL